MINDRAAIPRGIGWTSVAGALANLRELAAAVVEKFVVNSRSRAELFFDQTAKWRIEDASRVGARAAVAETTVQCGQAAGVVVGVRDGAARRICDRVDRARQTGASTPVGIDRVGP